MIEAGLVGEWALSESFKSGSFQVEADKQKLRLQMKKIRNEMDIERRDQCSGQICEKLAKNELFLQASYICFYAQLGSEVDVWPLWERARALGKHTAFPKVFGDTMRFFEVTDRGQLEEGCFHVLEPDMDQCEEVSKKGILVLTPGLMFDETGNRCGYGRGYYDRFFATHPDAVSIGIAFEQQMLEPGVIPVDTYDEPLRYIQTERRWIEREFRYEELVERISGCRRFGNEPGIVCSREALALLDNPQDTLRFVHIAGTNGKGSVAAFLHEICVQAGIRAGLFISPHLYEFRERISIGHVRIPEEAVVELGTRVLKVNDTLALSRQINLTMFDYCMAIAMLYFQRQQVELVILETGMGGRLDSTNVIEPPLVSVITKIGLEHTQYLGDTLTKIAGEKAGILKKGTHAVILRQDEESERELLRVCAEKQIDYELTQPITEYADADTFTYQGRSYRKPGMIGYYQQDNAAAAIHAARMLRALGFSRLTDEKISDGIAHAHWSGRMERVWDFPFVLLDGAHNPCGVQALADSLARAYPGEKFCFFMGVMADKDFVQMAQLILPVAQRIYTLTPQSDRALEADTLRQRMTVLAAQEGAGCDIGVVGDVRSLPKYFDQNRKNIIFGSLYLIGELRELLIEMRKNK